MSHDIFVSYSSEDKAVADAVVSALENSGLRCWVAPRDIKPSADWGDSITDAIGACRMVLLIFSGHSNQSKRVRDEIYYAISEEKIILPFRIENLDPTGSMRLHLSSRHWLDAFQPSWQEHISRLVGSAADSLGRELVQPAAKEEAPPPALAAPKESGRKAPWLWIGLAAGAIAILGAGGLLWSGSRDRQAAGPTEAPAVPIASNTAASPTRAPTPTVQPIIVTSAEDSGPGTLRQAILDAVPGDIITFDSLVFPADRPTSIFPRNTDSPSALPNLSQGGVTIDASNAGVILDGSSTQGSANGVEVYSDGNTVMGLQIINFGAQGITVCSGSHNVIGGDTNIGSGPSGQGNLIRDNGGFGLDLCNDITSFNVIRGNVIEDNGIGVVIEAGPRDNVIGPDNTITNNRGGGVEIGSLQAIANTITANAIYGNGGPGIRYNINDAAPYTYSTPPVILHFDLEAGMASGQACRDCVVEIFSTDTQDGKIYEGTITADDYGLFSFRTGKAFTGPFLTATSSPAGLNTSEFSPPTTSVSNIQIALDVIQHEAPAYQIGFDTWEFGTADGDARIDNGRLRLASESQNVHLGLPNLSSDRLAVGFDLRLLESGSDGRCYFGTTNDHEDQDSMMSIGAGFGPNGQAIMEHYVHPNQYPVLAERRYDQTDINTVTLLYLGDHLAAFVNGDLIYTLLDPNADTEYARHTLSAEGGITCEFDNFRLWDLRGVDFNP